MQLVQLRIEVSPKTSASVSYLSKRLGISKKITYALILDLFLYERDFDRAVANLKVQLQASDWISPDDKPDDIPF